MTRRAVVTTARYRSRMSRISTIGNVAGQTFLTFYCGELPVDALVREAGHEPSGYFWEGLVEYVAPQVVERVQLDSEAGMFSAAGDRADLELLAAELEPLLAGHRDVRVVIADAERDGHTLDS